MINEASRIIRIFILSRLVVKLKIHMLTGADFWNTALKNKIPPFIL